MAFAPFEHEVELVEQSAHEVVGELGGVQILSDRGSLLHHTREVEQDGRVARDQLVHVGTLHLDDDFFTGLQTRRVRLCNRRTADGCPVELGEDRVDRLPELRFEELLHCLARRRLDPALQQTQFGRELNRQQVVARRGHLSELYEQRARLLQRLAQPHAHRVFDEAVAPPARPDGQTVATRDAQDLAVPRPQREAPPHVAERVRQHQQSGAVTLRERAGPARRSRCRPPPAS